WDKDLRIRRRPLCPFCAQNPPSGGKFSRSDVASLVESVSYVITATLPIRPAPVRPVGHTRRPATLPPKTACRVPLAPCQETDQVCATRGDVLRAGRDRGLCMLPPPRYGRQDVWR